MRGGTLKENVFTFQIKFFFLQQCFKINFDGTIMMNSCQSRIEFRCEETNVTWFLWLLLDNEYSILVLKLELQN